MASKVLSLTKEQSKAIKNYSGPNDLDKSRAYQSAPLEDLVYWSLHFDAKNREYLQITTISPEGIIETQVRFFDADSPWQPTEYIDPLIGSLIDSSGAEGDEGFEDYSEDWA